MTTRRTILTALGLMPAAALPAVAATETPEERVERLTMELAEAMSALRGKPFRTVAHFDNDMVMIVDANERFNMHRRHRGDKLVREWPV